MGEVEKLSKAAAVVLHLILIEAGDSALGSVKLS